jgi:general secretion pathway protein G
LKLNSARRQRHGFTLIELLVVIIILAILAAVVVPRVIHHTDDARVSSAITSIKAFEDQIDVYHLDTNTLPSSDQGLQALISNPGSVHGWNGPYLKNEDKIPLDPWGHPYVYKQPGDNGHEYEIISAGPDGQIGTADDIQSWNLTKQ